MKRVRYGEIEAFAIENLVEVRDWLAADIRRSCRVLSDNRKKFQILFGDPHQHWTGEFRFKVWRFERDGLAFWILTTGTKGTCIEVEPPTSKLGERWSDADKAKVIAFLDWLDRQIQGGHCNPGIVQRYEESMEKTTIHQIRQVLMNDLGLTREFIREMATEIIIQTVEKETKHLDTSGRLDRIIGDQLEKHYRGPLGHWNGFEDLIKAAASERVGKFVDERIKVVADPDPAATDKKWSVLLLYPEFLHDQPETFFEHTTAATPEEAVEKIQQKAADANKDTDANDFRPLAVFASHIEMEHGVNDV